MKLNRRTVILITLNIFCLGLVLFTTACQPKPQLVSVTNIPDPNSALAKALKCDTSLDVPDEWGWMTRTISQLYQDNAEMMTCVLAGSYNLDWFNQSYFSIQYTIEKTSVRTIINANLVKTGYLSRGHEIAVPDFAKIGTAMLSGCRADSRVYSCIIAVQYTDYVALYGVFDFDIDIPFSSAEKLVNPILTQQDVLIRQKLTP